jgi:hypothetical protein
MTDPTNEAAWPSGFPVPTKADLETNSRYALEALNVALEAARLAIEAANEAPRKASHDQPTVSQTFEGWHAANLMVHEVFANLYAQARDTISVVQSMLPPR